VKPSITASSATLEGSIYYNSDNSLVATSGLALNGAVPRVRAGKPVELFAQSGQCEHLQHRPGCRPSEACKTRGDCCDRTQECIGGFCSDILR
jgi:hypothetical protein